MTYTLHDLAGNIGVAMIVVMFVLLQLKKIESKSFLYSFLNGVGAFLILVSLTQEFNVSAFILQAGWIIASAIGIWTWYKSKRKS